MAPGILGEQRVGGKHDEVPVWGGIMGTSLWVLSLRVRQLSMSQLPKSTSSRFGDINM